MPFLYDMVSTSREDEANGKTSSPKTDRSGADNHRLAMSENFVLALFVTKATSICP